MRLGVIDTETTSADPTTAKLVTLFYGIMEDDGSYSEQYSFLFNPGVEIDQAAIDVHGITNEKAVAEGIHPDSHREVLASLFALINRHTGELPIVAFNASYDFTVLNNAAKEHNLLLDITNLFIFDPFIVDKKFDKYRAGSRKQIDVARHYGVDVDATKTHDAAYDCYLAGQIAQSLFAHEAAKNYTKDIWLTNQKIWKKEQSESLQKYLRNKTNDDSIIVNAEWPVRMV